VLAPVDVLKVVAKRGPLSLDELDAAIPEPADGAPDGLWAALDAAVDHGYLKPVPQGWSVTLDVYRLTPRGRRLLRASAMGSHAA
jgi:hypothetical protein